jgi:hypothetical protein
VVVGLCGLSFLFLVVHHVACPAVPDESTAYKIAKSAIRKRFGDNKAEGFASLLNCDNPSCTKYHFEMDGQLIRLISPSNECKTREAGACSFFEAGDTWVVEEKGAPPIPPMPDTLCNPCSLVVYVSKLDGCKVHIN